MQSLLLRLFSPTSKYSCPQALALIELFNAPEGRYKQDVYLLPKKMGKQHLKQMCIAQQVKPCSFLQVAAVLELLSTATW